MRENDIQYVMMAWAAMCCEFSPPLFPTSTGVVLLTAMRGKCRLEDYRSLLCASESTVRSVVCRLCNNGVLKVERRRKKASGYAEYSLAPGGAYMVSQWVRGVCKWIKKLKQQEEDDE